MNFLVHISFLLSSSFIFFGQRAYGQKESASPRSLTSSDGSTQVITKCKWFINLAALIDVSHSYEDDMQNFTGFVPPVFDLFEEDFDGQSQLAVLTFSDKPIDFYGDDNDMCAQLNLPFTKMDTADNVQRARTTIDGLVTDSGGDYVELYIDSVVRALGSDAVGWPSTAFNPETGRPNLNLVLGFTDAPSHPPVSGTAAPAELKSFPISKLLTDEAAGLNLDVNHKCSEANFADGDSLRAQLLRRNARIITFAGKNHYRDWEDRPQYWAQFEDLIQSNPAKSARWRSFPDGLREWYKDYFNDVASLPQDRVLVENSTPPEGTDEADKRNWVSNAIRRFISTLPPPRCQPKEGVVYDTDPRTPSAETPREEVRLPAVTASLQKQETPKTATGETRTTTLKPSARPSARPKRQPHAGTSIQ